MLQKTELQKKKIRAQAKNKKTMWAVRSGPAIVRRWIEEARKHNSSLYSTRERSGPSDEKYALDGPDCVFVGDFPLASLPSPLLRLRQRDNADAEAGSRRQKTEGEEEKVGIGEQFLSFVPGNPKIFRLRVGKP
jgi:hypothetical protein